ncbi:hypothetical protein FQZ97_1079870 [compost metagenome]
MADADAAAEALQGLAKAAFAGLADRQFRARADQGDMPRRRAEQAGGEQGAGLLVVADHRADARRIEGAVDGDHRHAGRKQAQVGRIVLGQATGDDQRVAAP